MGRSRECGGRGVVAQFLDVPPFAVRIIHGLTSRSKVIEIKEGP